MPGRSAAWRSGNILQLDALKYPLAAAFLHSRGIFCFHIIRCCCPELLRFAEGRSWLRACVIYLLPQHVDYLKLQSCKDSGKRWWKQPRVVVPLSSCHVTVQHQLSPWSRMACHYGRGMLDHHAEHPSTAVPSLGLSLLFSEGLGSIFPVQSGHSKKWWNSRSCVVFAVLKWSEGHLCAML